MLNSVLTLWILKNSKKRFSPILRVAALCMTKKKSKLNSKTKLSQEREYSRWAEI
jgi:hypothetical protein